MLRYLLLGGLGLFLSAPAAAKLSPLVVLEADLLTQRPLAPALRIDHATWLHLPRVIRACAGQLRPGADLVVFFPQSDRCEVIRNSGKVRMQAELTAIHPALAGAQVRRRLDQDAIAVVRPVARPRFKGLLCTCPTTNQVPEGAVQCASQNTEQNRPVAPIEFMASDADGDTLTPAFSHTLDGGGSVAELPSPLVSDCASQLGTLSCTVTGRSPTAGGNYVLTLAVSDGSAVLELDAELAVTADPDRPFDDSFEALICD